MRERAWDKRRNIPPPRLKQVSGLWRAVRLNDDFE